MEYMLYGDLKTSLLARHHLVNERNRLGHGMEYMLYGDLKTYLLARRHLVNKINRWGHGVQYMRYLTSASLPASCQ